MKETKILIADDDINICNILKLYLEKENFKVEIASDGKEAIELFKESLPDLVLLDIMMPEIDGWEVCQFIRSYGECFIVIISAKGEAFDKVFGLNLGADDYISKPFEVKEVVARVKAVLRRSNIGIDSISNIFKVEYDKLVVDIKDYCVLIDEKLMTMPPKEIDLLFFLASRPNKVFTRAVLLHEIWGVGCCVDIRTVDVHIKRLREKLQGVTDRWELKTVWGVGYKFETY
ncbi:MAG: response regulator transcription factor [Oscillospiraceae bacterium]|nr:response regulator transcription factor [Oscillospiraceae bacterium]